MTHFSIRLWQQLLLTSALVLGSFQQLLEAAPFGTIDYPTPVRIEIFDETEFKLQIANIHYLHLYSQSNNLEDKRCVAKDAQGNLEGRKFTLKPTDKNLDRYKLTFNVNVLQQGPCELLFKSGAIGFTLYSPTTQKFYLLRVILDQFFRARDYARSYDFDISKVSPTNNDLGTVVVDAISPVIRIYKED